MLSHHPLANLFPLLDGPEFAALVEDVRRNGLNEPIVLLDGKVLDGRNRDAACAQAGVEPRYVEFAGDDPLAFVISANLHRRHLSESQRAMVAAKLATLKDGQRADRVEQALPIGRASELLNVGARSVARAREVRDRGAPELVHAVESGDVAVSTAADLATLPSEQQAEIVARGEREILRTAKEIRARATEQRHAGRIQKLAGLATSVPMPQRRSRSCWSTHHGDSLFTASPAKNARPKTTIRP
jgi:hypothetical protein